jgi:hypothetical protein
LVHFRRGRPASLRTFAACRRLWLTEGPIRAIVNRPHLCQGKQEAALIPTGLGIFKQGFGISKSSGGEEKVIASGAKKQLLDFVIERAFEPVMRAKPDGRFDGERKKLEHVQTAARSEIGRLPPV